MSDQVLLRDLIAIPDEVHAGDFVLSLARGVGQKSTITDYVATEQLAANFDRALGVIKSALETHASRAAYLDGSFGSGKSHFMAMLYAILDGDPDARGKKGLADVVAKHDPWLRGRRFLERTRVRETLEALTEQYQKLNDEFDRRARIQWASTNQASPRCCVC